MFGYDLQFKSFSFLKLYTLQPLHLNNTVKAEKEWVFFNRLEKVGSQSMIALLTDLSKVNNFAAYTNSRKAYIRQLYTEEEEQEIAEELDSVDEPMSYSEHTNWINFTKHELPKPIYINLVRHPIHKVMSAYYFIRKPEVYAFYVKNFNRPLEKEEYFKTSFNDCVKQAERKDCIFDPHIEFNSDWRRFAMRFCGNRKECMYGLQ